MDTNNFIPYAMADDPYFQAFLFNVGRQFQPQPFYPNDPMIPQYYMTPPSYAYTRYPPSGVWMNSSDHHPSMYGTLVDEVALIVEPPTYTGFVEFVDGVMAVTLDTSTDVRDYDDLFEIDEEMGLVSYEDLLEMEEQVGRVNVGLSEETISKHLKTSSTATPVDQNEEDGAEICVVCQYEYESNETVGTLRCGHHFHADCIKEWLLQQNVCPICKSTALEV